MLRAKGKDTQADMVRNIIPAGVECIFVRQAEQLGLGHAVLCAERAIGGDPFAVLLSDNFLTDREPGVTADLAQSFARSGKSQLSVMEVDGPDISKYGVVVPNGSGTGIAGLVEKPDADDAPSNLASIGRYVLTPDIFDTLRGLQAGLGGEIQLADAINIHAQQGSVETVRLNGRRFDCGSVDGFLDAIMHQAKR
jgi:UTP--glucose-1-phosphate uridylyltransferase